MQNFFLRLPQNIGSILLVIPKKCIFLIKCMYLLLLLSKLTKNCAVFLQIISKLQYFLIAYYKSAWFCFHKILFYCKSAKLFAWWMAELQEFLAIVFLNLQFSSIYCVNMWLLNKIKKKGFSVVTDLIKYEIFVIM